MTPPDDPVLEVAAPVGHGRLGEDERRSVAESIFPCGPLHMIDPIYTSSSNSSPSSSPLVPRLGFLSRTRRGTLRDPRGFDLRSQKRISDSMTPQLSVLV